MSSRKHSQLRTPPWKSGSPILASGMPCQSSKMGCTHLKWWRVPRCDRWTFSWMTLGAARKLFCRILIGKSLERVRDLNISPVSASMSKKKLRQTSVAMRISMNISVHFSVWKESDPAFQAVGRRDVWSWPFPEVGWGRECGCLDSRYVFRHVMIYIHIYVYVYRHNPLREDRISYDGWNFRFTLISFRFYPQWLQNIDDFVYYTCKIICSIYICIIWFYTCYCIYIYIASFRCVWSQ